jgi:hypothetical protein
MELQTYFSDFLSNIRLTKAQRDDCITGHKTLRDRLFADETLKPILVSSFLQGSYRRATAVKPKLSKRSDVDVVIVTKLSHDDYTPDEAMDLFLPFMEKHYSGRYHKQGRSIGIELSYVDLDLVITAAPSEAQQNILMSKSVTAVETPEDVLDWRLSPYWIPPMERNSSSLTLIEKALKEAEWQLEPLLIPDREAETWEQTHPLAQIQWTWTKNRATNTHYVNVVKALKWWRRLLPPEEQQYPKGYPVEHMIGASCRDGITSVAQGVTEALEDIVSRYAYYAMNGLIPNLPDHGVPNHNVLHRLTVEDFKWFYSQCETASQTARNALDAPTTVESAELWRKLFGSEFPEPPESSTKSSPPPSGGYTARSEPSTVPGRGRYA